ncbi:MAG: WGR domain-containing protein [Candidatus Competibacterales bacterium]
MTDPETWQVELAFKDAKSDKFWRARVQGNGIEINYGRTGSAGQRQFKRYSSPEDAAAELEKQARSKRNKGYWDQATPSPQAQAPAPATQGEVPPPVPATRRREWVFPMGERELEITLTLDGDAVHTAARERYGDEAKALSAFEDLCRAMEAEGYRPR